MSDFLRSLLLYAISVAAPALYNFLTDLAPGIPLTESNFVAFLVWLAAALTGGAAAARFVDFLRVDVQGMATTKSQVRVQSAVIYIIAFASVAAAILFTI